LKKTGIARIEIPLAYLIIAAIPRINSANPTKALAADTLAGSTIIKMNVRQRPGAKIITRKVKYLAATKLHRL
jgi:hypothetical protein